MAEEGAPIGLAAGRWYLEAASDRGVEITPHASGRQNVPATGVTSAGSARLPFRWRLGIIIKVSSENAIMKPMHFIRLTTLAALSLSSTTNLVAQQTTGNDKANSAELAKKLQNPVADLISVPVQNNWDFGIGPEDAMRFTANIQPVIPFSMTKEWNLITRTIVPVIYAESPVAGGGDDNGGLGDITQSFFFSPKAPTGGGWIWGVGPVFLYPSATDNALGTE
ncbi:MAG: hypothetical protein ACREVF_09925, partial [Burkholderiales bacterium]